MYRMHLLKLLPPSRDGTERYGGRLTSGYVREDALLAAEPPPPEHMQVAFKAINEPVLKLRRHGEAGWTEHRYTSEDWRLTDVDALEGRLYSVTDDGEHVAEVALRPRVEVAIMKTESYEESVGRDWEAGMATRHHVFDLRTDKTVNVVELKTRAGRIESLGLLSKYPQVGQQL